MRAESPTTMSQDAAWREPVQAPTDEVHIRLRFPVGGVAVDYRAARHVAARVARELDRYGVEVTIDDEPNPDHPPLPDAHAWE
ncbi:hypothetical protein BJY24_004810 [Nocardia transvalensis]|uniref:Uncharacterized protein n=1 Tax=Nocardia transvalensis TaxID=37333 RepID=A0A7W9PHN6_9NOCA|nr:hypothetical protein [Nocardia transvalensis]MBB5915898.1 hypothetical protein [Nocardia transvalensis]